MSVFEQVIGWLAPATCVGCETEGSSLCASCAAAEILAYGERCYGCGALAVRSRTCKRCRRGGSPRYVWVVTDYAGLPRDLLRTFKFKHRRAAAQEISELMVETLKRYNTDADLTKANYLVVAVPTATSRLRERGFDHAQLLAKNIARNLQLKDYQGLFRLGQSRQVGAKRQARLAHKDHNYYVRMPGKLAGRNVLLIDDVTTTGATLKIAAKVLRAAGAKRIDALVFAKRI